MPHLDMSGEEATQLAVGTFLALFSFFVGEGGSELVLRRDSMWPSTVPAIPREPGQDFLARWQLPAA